MTARPQAYLSVAAFSLLSGAPFGLLNDALPVYLKTQGLSLSEIGLWQIVHLPFTLKLLLGPIVDRFPEPTRWLRWTCLTLALGIGAFASVNPRHLPLLICIAMTMAMAAGLADVVIDGTYLRHTSPERLPIGNWIRITAYRIGKIASDSGFLLLATSVTWPIAFVALAASYGLLALFIAKRSLRHSTAAKLQPTLTFTQIWQANRAWLQQPSMLYALLFLLLFRLPDFIMTPMIAPFWMDRGASIQALAMINNTGGMLLLIAGFYVTGWWLLRAPLENMLLGVWCCQIIPNLGYALVAWLPNEPAYLPYLYGISMLENFTQGIGQGAIVAIMTKLCQPTHAATQFSLLSAIFNIPRILAGMASGYLAQLDGYHLFFYTTTLAGLPGLVLLFSLRHSITTLFQHSATTATPDSQQQLLSPLNEKPIP